MVIEVASWLDIKEKGNLAYKNHDWENAIFHYTEGLNIVDDPKNKAVLLKNRAAVYLKKENFPDAICDCTAALEISPQDPKALFRRAQAYDSQENYEKAFTDAKAVQSLDPKNKEVQLLLSKLHVIIQAKIEKNTQLSGKIEQLFDILFDLSSDNSKRITSANNLVALSKEKSGASLLIERDVLGKLVSLLKTEKNSEILIACTRALSEFAKDCNTAKLVLQDCGITCLMDLLNSSNLSEVTATQYTFQTLLSTFSGIDIKKETKPDLQLMEENKKQIDAIMMTFTKSITNRAMTGICRNAIIELLTRNFTYKALDWSNNFYRLGGIKNLIEVASELKEYHYESSMNVTDDTRMITAVCLDKLYYDMYSDKDKSNFIEEIDSYFKEMLSSPDIESKVRVTVAITTLLLGPIEAGNVFIGREGILEMMLVMANSGDELQQKISCEALIAAASKKDKCQSIMTQGTNILKDLYKSSSDAIKVRALVGLCKLGSLGGSDATMKPFADGASLKLAEACRRFLINPSKDKDMRKWATEGLSYLTLDADVKEKLIEDRVALRSMFELGKSGDLNCLYGLTTTLVNLCNAYDKQEIIPEMVELAKFAKQHIPEEHDLDDQDFVDKRTNILANEGAPAALVVLSKTDSENSRELIARVLNAICQQQQNRGKVVQQGGTKALLNMALRGTAKGKKCAAQALARIAITINPEVAFPGQRAYEVVRPFLQLMDIEGMALENFEALLGLCNIAGISESTRQRILKEKGLSMIEHYMYEDHEMIRRAAVQCMSNMCSSPDVVQILEGENDKLKYLFLITSDPDEEIVKAASGALCIILPQSEICCKKIFAAKDWKEILLFMVSNGNKEVLYRGVVIVYYLVSCNKEIAEKIVDTHCKDAIFALSKIENPELVETKSRECSLDIIKIWRNYKFISEENED